MYRRNVKFSRGKSFQMCGSHSCGFFDTRYPMTVASAERNFSKHILTKTYHTVTIDDERVSLLAILSVENDIAENLDWTTLVNEFTEI